MPGSMVSPSRSGARSPAFKEIWKKDPAFGPSQAVALALHGGLIILTLFLLHRLPNVIHPPELKTYLDTPGISPYGIQLPPGKDGAGGGGGGGDHSSLPVTIGKAPKFTVIQMAPPWIPRISHPILVAEPSLVGPPELQFPSSNLSMWGDPLAKMVTYSDGSGAGGGMGDGEGTGDGRGHGPGLGSGRNGGTGNGPYRPAFNGVGYPACAYCPDAKYPEVARKAKYQS
jgi:hypothetical protein